MRLFGKHPIRYLDVTLTVVILASCPASFLHAQTGAARAPAQQADPERLPDPGKGANQIPDPGVTPKTNSGFEDIPVEPIDLLSALKLAGVGNPEMMIARQRVVEAVARRQWAAAQILPTANAGGNYNNHSGALQQASGNILDVTRDALYLGAGSNAVAAGTVNIPGLVYSLNISESIFACLRSQQLVIARGFANQAVNIDVSRRIGERYMQLLQAHQLVAVNRLTRDDARDVADLTARFARAGQGRKADADRAAAELDGRDTELVASQGRLVAASARLAQLLNLSPGKLLAPLESKAVPVPIVPDPIAIRELLAVSLLHRPELAERQAEIRRAMLELEGAKVLPFSPTVIVGLSGGGFGGGSDLVASSRNPRFGAPLNQPRFGNFGSRNDFDAVAYWTLRNLGAGNLAMVNVAASRVQTAELERLAVFNRVRAEVVEAYVEAQIAFRQIALNESAVKLAARSLEEEKLRIKGGIGLPIELLTSLEILAEARLQYVESIIDYNMAQIRLYAALGQPHMDVLARPAHAAAEELPQPNGGAARPQGENLGGNKQ